MSRCILTQLRFCCGIGGLRVFPVGGGASNWRCYSRRRNNSNEPADKSLGQTTILVQQGCDIQELPVILRKIGQDDFTVICGNNTSSMVGDEKLIEQSDDRNEIDGLQSTALPQHGVATTTDVDSDEKILEINEAITTSGVLTVIDGVTDEELTPEMAVIALDKIMRLETLPTLRSLELDNEIFNRIIVCITQRGDTKTLLDTLDIMRMFLEMRRTVERICAELLIRNSDGILSVVEICEAIQKFVECQQQESAEKFWSGLADLEKSINDKNIKFIYEILPRLRVSRRMVVGVIERRITNVWWQMSADAVTQVLTSLDACKVTPPRTVASMTRWLNTNIHAVTESTLEQLVRCMTRLDHTDSQLEKSLERYVKARGVKIRTQSLVAAILDHCVHFRLRNAHILNGCAEYFASNSASIEPQYLTNIFCPFGVLDFQPSNALKFWRTLESYVDSNFGKLTATQVVDVMLACVYLEKYPLNFVRRVFNPYFLDVMHSTTATEKLHKLRADLKLFDTALTLECAEYQGPMLPRDQHAKSMWQDGRIKRIVNGCSDQLTLVAGGLENISKCVVLQTLPMHPLYVIDVLMHPPGMGNMFSFNSMQDRNVHVAVLVMLPDHYDAAGEGHLIGPQRMRIRHLRRLGLKVVTLDYVVLAKMRVHARELHKYLIERMKFALPALNPA